MLFFLSATTQLSQARLDTFRQALRDLGYVDGQNVTIEVRSAEGNRERLPTAVAELIDANVHVIVTSGTEAVQAAQKATSTIPIVITNMGDPVGAGVVKNLSKPGGNITGLSLLATGTSIKWLELLRDAIPKLTRVGVLWNPDNASDALKVKEIIAAASVFGVQVGLFEARRADDISPAVEMVARAKVDALLATGDTLLNNHRVLVIELATKYKIPVLGEFGFWTDSGALLSYGANIFDLVRRSATYVDKIFKGAKPGDLPIEQPMRFDTVVNLKTAKVLGITIPPLVLVQATRVIE
jgi:putative ABC transport system substrate-binding protein